MISPSIFHCFIKIRLLKLAKTSYVKSSNELSCAPPPPYSCATPDFFIFILSYFCYVWPTLLFFPSFWDLPILVQRGRRGSAPIQVGPPPFPPIIACACWCTCGVPQRSVSLRANYWGACSLGARLVHVSALGHEHVLIAAPVWAAPHHHRRQSSATYLSTFSQYSRRKSPEFS